MRERIRCHAPARIALQTIVTDRLRGREPFVDVAGLQHPIGLIRVIRPHAREAIGLQLHRDLQPIPGCLVAALLRRLHLVGRAEQCLHVMTHLVADYVRGREVAGAAEPRQVAKEGRVEIHAPVARAIEGSGRGARESARRLNRAVEQLEQRRRIPPALLRKDLTPHVLRAAQDGRDELAVVIVRRQWRAFATARRDTVAAAQELQHRVGPTDEIRDDEQRDRAEAAADAP